MAIGYSGFIIDLDGTIYRGNDLIEGAAETVHMLRSLGKRMVFLSNRGNISRRMCHEKMCGMGLDVRLEEILLASTVTARFLQREHSGKAVWVLGEEGLREELEQHDVRIAAKPEEADWLVITLHEKVTYQDLNLAFRAARSGAKIIATNEDRSFPREDGHAIDVAGMIGAITQSTGAEVEVVIGKPSAKMAEAALNQLRLPPEQCLVIGDSPASDIALARRAGISSALVLTGSVSSEDASASIPAPDYIWNSIEDLLLEARV